MTGFTEADIRAGTIVKPEMDTLLAGLTDTQLRRIIRAVAENQPAFAAAIEQEVKWLKMDPAVGSAGTATPAAHSIAVDVTAIRREMRKDFRQVESTGGGYSNHYWEDDEAGMIDPDEVLSPHWQTAEALLAAGDAAAATEVITAMIEEWGEGITGLSRTSQELSGRRSRPGCSNAWSSPRPTTRLISTCTSTCWWKRWRRSTDGHTTLIWIG